jgi:hypothetical protein
MRNIFLLLFLAAWSTAIGQEDLSTHFMRNTWQANKTNPAFFPDYKVVVALPGLYNTLRVSNLTYNDVVVNNVVDPRTAISALDDMDNIIRQNLDIETLSLAARFGNFGVSLSHAARLNAYLNYPKALPQLIWEGNAQFIGETVDFAPDIDVFSYQEVSLGVMYDISPNFSVGGRFKFLSGVTSISSSGNMLELSTSDDVYQLNMNADYTVNTSNSIDYDGFDELDVQFDFGSGNNGQLFSSNTGFSFDLGARFAFDKLELAASFLDLGGSINWEEEVANYSLEGDYEFEGLQFAEDILEDTTEFGNVLDTLEAVYDFTETNDTYSTKLPTRIYLSGNYQLTDYWTAGAVFYSESYRGELFTAVALASNIEVLSFLNLGATYAFRSGTFDNLGLNTAITLGPVQLLAATDNIFTAFRPADSNSANVRLGLNLVFGKMDAVDKLNKGNSSFY